MPRPSIPRDTPFLAHSVSWTGGEPHLVIASPLETERRTLNLVGERLAFHVDPTGRFCTGVFIAKGSSGGRHEPCDGARLATTGRQCERCASRDESRFMHHAHRGGHVPEALGRYLGATSLALHRDVRGRRAQGRYSVRCAQASSSRRARRGAGHVRRTHGRRARRSSSRGRRHRARRCAPDASQDEQGRRSHPGAARNGARCRARRLRRRRRGAPANARPLRALDAPRGVATPGAARGVLRRRPWHPPRLRPPRHRRIPLPDARQPRRIGRAGQVNAAAEAEAEAEGAAGDAADSLMLVDLDALGGRRVTFDDAARSPESVAQHSLF